MEQGVNERGWSFRVVAKYGVLQLPALFLIVSTLIVVKRWVEVSPLFFWGVILIWIVKDVMMFPFVWRAYDGTASGYESSLKGARGVAREVLEPDGYVQVQGELWQSQLTGKKARLDKGDEVRVMDVQGLTLLVEPEEKREK